MIVRSGENRCKNIEFAVVIVAFGRPEQVFDSVEVFGNGKNRHFFRPVFEIFAYRAGNAVFPRALIKIIFSVIKKNEGIAAGEFFRSFQAACGSRHDFRVGCGAYRNVHVGNFHHCTSFF